MSFSDYWRVIRNKWKIIIAMMLLGLTVGGSAFVLMKREYESTSMFLVTIVGASNLEEANYSYSILSEAMETIPEAASTSAVLVPAAQRAHVPVDFAALQKSVTASRKVNTFTVEVKAQADSAQASADLANAVVTRIGELLPSIIRFPVAGQAKVELQPLTVANPPEKPSSPSLPVNLGVGLGAGTLLGLTIAVAATNSKDANVPARELRTNAGSSRLDPRSETHR